MDLADAIEYVRPSIVQIAVLPGAAAHGTQLNMLGTGFWVSEDGLRMTARQVIEDAQRLMTSLPGSSLMIGQAILGLPTRSSQFEVLLITSDQK